MNHNEINDDYLTVKKQATSSIVIKKAKTIQVDSIHCTIADSSKIDSVTHGSSDSIMMHSSFSTHTGTNSIHGKKFTNIISQV